VADLEGGGAIAPPFENIFPAKADEKQVHTTQNVFLPMIAPSKSLDLPLCITLMMKDI